MSVEELNRDQLIQVKQFMLMERMDAEGKNTFLGRTCRS